MMKHYWKATRRAWHWGIKLHGTSRHGLANALWRSISVLQFKSSHAQEWFAQLERPELRPFVEANPRLAFRPTCPYLSAAWKFRKRAKVVFDTYEFIHGHGGALKECMLKPEGILLASFPAAKNQEASVRLGFDNQMRKEGEISISLESRCFSGCKLALSLELMDRGWVCYIGSIQGRPGDEEGVRLLTKALHGIRPKAFMVFLAQEIVRALRITEILGVGNEIHILRGRKPFLLERRKEVLFDYDELWREAGGVSEGEGWFKVPLKTYRRQPDEIKPNKRSQYAKRYALMDAISLQINTVLGPFQRS